MPKNSAVTFGIQEAKHGEEVVGSLLSGLVTKDQLGALRDLIDSEDYQRTKRWRGQFQELAIALVGAIDEVVEQ